jgi:hypothetical protein
MVGEPELTMEERVDVRRRGRSLVPSESELLVGIDVT